MRAILAAMTGCTTTRDANYIRGSGIDDITTGMRYAWRAVFREYLSKGRDHPGLVAASLVPPWGVYPPGEKAGGKVSACQVKYLARFLTLSSNDQAVKKGAILHQGLAKVFSGDLRALVPLALQRAVFALKYLNDFL